MEDKLKEEMEELIDHIKSLSSNINDILDIMDHAKQGKGSGKLITLAKCDNHMIMLDADTLCRVLDVVADVYREKAVIARNRLYEVINELCMIKGVK